MRGKVGGHRWLAFGEERTGGELMDGEGDRPERLR